MTILDLNGKWQFAKNTSDDKYPVTVPGSVLSGLLDNNIIEDPYFRENEYASRELFWDDYYFERDFEVSEELLAENNIELVCLGIDTIADIIINGKKIAHTENMHRTYRFEIKEYLSVGNNSIKVYIYSPLKAINAYEEKPGKEITVAPAGGILGNQYIRKAHSMFGWDWGAQLPDCGIWRDIYLEGFSDIRISDVKTNQIHEDGKVTLNVSVKFDRPAESRYKISATITHAYCGIKRLLATKSQTKSILVNIGEESKDFSYEIEEPQLWWPNDQGEQNLYNLDVSLKPAGVMAGGASALEINKIKPVSEKHLTLGLRTIGISREKDEWGEEFALIVNGQKFFSMGADYIPEDHIYSKITREGQEHLISSAARAHHNMVRVWGGGYYPSDDFYDLCDKYGLVVWQDLMYACNVYDLTDEFEENIVSETRDNVRRLRHHACLGLWCGNNEMESAWEHWGWKQTEGKRLEADYIKMYEYILPKVIKEEDPDTLYWPSSPSSGGGFDNPDDENRGDAHYWAVWHGQKPFTDYLKHYFRFCSEYGFQSFPSIKTVENYTLPEDRNIFSPVMESHQKNDSANGKMLYYLAENFKYPKDFESLLYATQILQAEAVKAGAEHWRRNRGRCMGALYWQINDNWPVASWASIDYFGRWKPLHYMSKRFFNPVAASILKTGGENEHFSGAQLFIANESKDKLKVSVKMYLKKINFEVVCEKSAQVTVLPFSSQMVLDCDYSNVLIPEIKKCQDKKIIAEVPNAVSRRDVFVCAQVDIEREDGNITTQVVSDVLAPYKYINLQNVTPSVSVNENEDGFEASVKADTFTPFVFLETKKADVIFDDNCFNICSENATIIKVQKKDIFNGEVISAEDLINQITVKTLQSTYMV